MSGSLSNLLRQTTIDDHDQLLAAADAALKQSSNDETAQHIRTIALLKLERYDEALQALELGGESLKKKAGFEYAYALYRTGRPEEAAKIAEQERTRGGRHLAAQACYRSEDFTRAAELYASLASQSGEVANEAVDIRINAGAVDAQLEWSGQGHLAKSRKPGREDLEAFETAYNAACGNLCNALEDLSEDDKRAELLPITVQQVYVLTRLGKANEAQRLGSEIGANEISDQTSQNIARINSVAASDAENPFILQRLARSSTKIPPSDRPFAFQKSAMIRNDSAIALSTQKFEGANRSGKSAAKVQSMPTMDTAANAQSALGAAAHARQSAGKDALNRILPELERRPNDVGLILIVIQLYVSTGNHDMATTVLESFFARLESSTKDSDTNVRFAPGLVGTLISLYNVKGRTAQARRELARASQHWRHRFKTSGVPVNSSTSNLLKITAGTLLESQNQEDQNAAHEIIVELQKSTTSDAYINAAAIASTSMQGSKSSKAQDISAFNPVERLTSAIDVNALEEAGIARPPQSKFPATASKRPADQAAAPKKKQKIKPSKMPRDYDPNKKPDPERWLPLRDRSTYRPKGKKGKQRSNMLAQGAVEETSRPATPASEVQKGGGGPAKNQAKKKKGKGGKW